MGTRRVRKSIECKEPCGKVGLPSWTAADKLRLRLNRIPRRRGDDFTTNVFFCDICAAWHVGRVWRNGR